MTTNSYNGVVSTNGEFKTVSSLTDFTFTLNSVYTIQATRPCYIKIADAVFPLEYGKAFQFKQGADDLYIKVNYGVTALSILEGSAS